MTNYDQLLKPITASVQCSLLLDPVMLDEVKIA